jgi:hypothetical protein
MWEFDHDRVETYPGIVLPQVNINTKELGWDNVFDFM